MLTKISLQSISNWKPSFLFPSATNFSIINQKPSSINPLLSSNRSWKNQEFQRFFTKKVQQNEISKKSKNSLNIEELEKLAANNDAEAAYIITQKLGERAATRGKFEKYLKQAADLGHEAAMYEYGVLTITNQLKTQNDPRVADKCLKLVIKEGKPNYLYSTAVYYYRHKNAAEGERCLKMAVNKGHPDAMTLYADILIDQNPEESMKLFKKAIEKGDPVAMYFYAINVYDDKFKGQKIDRKEAFKYMKMSADTNGVKESIIECARMLHDGDLCEKNVKKSLFYYKKAADFYNDADSQYIYGQALYNGYEDVKPDLKIGALYMKKAAYHNHPVAAYKTAQIFRNGKGLFVMPNRSYQFFRSSAEAGFIPAIRECAYSFFTGKYPDFKKDLTFAAKYIQNGAQLKDHVCIFNLGLIYMSGEGIRKDYEKGKYYLGLAEKNGFANALEIGEKIYKNKISAIDYIKP